MRLAERIVAIQVPGTDGPPGFERTDYLPSQLLDALQTRSREVSTSTCVIRGFPIDVEAEYVFRDLPILGTAELLQPTEAYSVRYEFDDRLTSLGGTQSNLPILWAEAELNVEGRNLRIDLAQLAQLDHIGFERCLIFRSETGELLASLRVGEWSRAISFGESDTELIARFLLKEIAFDGSRMEVAHSCVRPLKADFSAVEAHLDAELPPFFPSSEDNAFREEESSQEADWIFRAIPELSDYSEILTTVGSVNGLDRLVARKTLNRQLVLFDSESVWRA